MKYIKKSANDGDTNPTLEELLAKVTEENVHGEVDFGPAVRNLVTDWIPAFDGMTTKSFSISL